MLLDVHRTVQEYPRQLFVVVLESFSRLCELTVSESFTAVAHGKRDECLVGMLTDEGIRTMEEQAKRAAQELQELKATRSGLALQPDSFVAAKLLCRKDVSPDSRCFLCPTAHCVHIMTLSSSCLLQALHL